MNEAFRAYIAEFVGTFALVFIGTGVAAMTGSPELGHGDAKWLEISLAFGFTLMVLVYAIGPVSGCHVNPAVSLPMAISGRLPWSRFPGYLIAQIIGAIVASMTLHFLINQTDDRFFHDAVNGIGANGNPTEMTDMALLMWEGIFTALFVLTIFAVTRKDAAPGIAGLGIGGFLLVAHLVGAQLGDSSLNPARSLGPALIEKFVMSKGEALQIVWIFVVGPLVGGVVGWVVYKAIYED